jgi:signal transduction histidine kinase
MSRQRHVHLYGIAAAFAAVALLFATATAIVTLSTRAIDTGVAALNAAALPSLDELLEAEADLRQLVPATLALAEAPEALRSARILALFDFRTAFDREMRTYLDLTSNGEHALYVSQAPSRLHDLDATLDRIRQAALDPEAVRRQLKELYGDVESVDAVVRDLMRMNASQAQTTVRRIAEVHTASVRLAPLLDAGSAVLAAIAAALALRAARRYAATMERNAELLTERASELEVFDRRVAHDLLNPLTTVDLSMTALARRHADAPTRELLERAQRALRRSRELVEGILDFARSGAHPGSGAQSALSKAVQAAVESVGSADGVSPADIRVEPSEDVAVACEGAVLVTMLTNLLSNAVKYTRGMPVREVVVRPIVSPDRVRVEVQDTGPGFPSSMEETLFEPYVRAPNATQPGIGLGLATVKRFATAYGGAVGVRQLERGSVFWFELPRAHPSAVAAQASRASRRWAPWRRARVT